MNIDWSRVQKSIWQRFRKEPHLRSKIPDAMEMLKAMLSRTGEQSKNRQAARNIGMSLVENTDEKLTVVSPICLAFDPRGENLATASALVDKHVAFLRSFEQDIPAWKLVCLFTPSERPGEEVDSFIGETFRLTGDKYRSQKDVAVEARMMASYAPGIIAMEDLVIQEISESPYLSRLANRLMRQRAKYYGELGIQNELWLRRTRRTMAQYILLGRHAAANGFIMCNHSTANIQCYLYAGAGVLHNPVGFR